MHKQIKLDNGLVIVSCRMPNKQSLALGIWIKVGGRYESESQKGISHFLEHLLFKGSKKYSCRKLKESIEGVGGSLNGFTSEELTCYLVKIPSRYLRLTLEILSDMVLNPALPRIEVEKERQVILEELKMYKDQPQSYVYELLDELLWPKQPLGMPVIGTVESLHKITQDDLDNFAKKHYLAPNIVISAAGSLDDEKLIKDTRKIFSQRLAQQPNAYAPAQEKQDKPQLKLFYKATEQTHLALGFHSYKRAHHLRHALGLLHIILGANMSSRLFNELREKRGLAYEIGTQVRRFYDTGVFIVHAGIDNRKVNESVELILKELSRLKHNLVLKDEFRRAKEFYLGQLGLALEDTLDYMLWIGESTTTEDKTYSLSQIISQVNKIKRQDIREAAGEIFQDRKMNLALIGPLKGIEAELSKQLHLGQS